MPRALQAQLQPIAQACELLNAPALSAAGFEADDVIAAVVAAATRRGASDVVIVAQDKDLLQLVRTDAGWRIRERVEERCYVENMPEDFEPPA